MVSSFIPTYYEATPLKTGVPRFTSETTKKPVSEINPFYHEKQNGGKCSIHSMDAFAGRQVVNIPNLLKVNNDTQKAIFANIGILDINFLKVGGFYLENLAGIDAHGVNPASMKSYIEKYKDEFNLPKDSIINVKEGPLTSLGIQEEISRIQNNSNLHRLILGISAKHYLAIRKDKTGRWRVVDSQTESHDPTSRDKTKKIQPRFTTLKDAVAHVSLCYHNNACILITPTKEKTDSLCEWLAEKIGMCCS